MLMLKKLRLTGCSIARTVDDIMDSLPLMMDLLYGRTLPHQCLDAVMKLSILPAEKDIIYGLALQLVLKMRLTVKY